MELKGSKTATNLMTAFAGECQAVMRYKMYASQAKKEGLEVIQAVFEETAENERAHANRLYKYLKEELNDEGITINAEYPVHLGDTLTNLRAAAEGEEYEHSDMYPTFAEIAKEEGFKAIAATLKEIGEVEEHHDKRYTALADRLEKDTLFERDEEVYWICLNCGYVHKGKKLLRNVRHVITHKDSSKFYSKIIKNYVVTFVAAFLLLQNSKCGII